MKLIPFFDFVRIDEFSATPKYIQLTNGVLNAIENGRLKKDEMLPSINELSNILDISRDTAENGYKHLKKLGALGSVPGKGYYILSVDFKRELNVVLFFNKLSAHKKIIYDAFIEAIGEDVAVDFYIYNNDFPLFKKLILNPKRNYTHYVIIPHFIDEKEGAAEIINSIPKEKLIILGKKIQGIKGDYAAVYENFSKDIYNALEQAKVPLSKYHTLKLIFPNRSYFPRDIVNGFYKFCQKYAFTYSLVSNIKEESIAKGEVYINLMEDDLVELLDQIMTLNLKVGEDVGVISYNETPLKKFIMNGITTVSTDFRHMGTTVARLILDKSKKHEEVPFYLTLRSSI